MAIMSIEKNKENKINGFRRVDFGDILDYKFLSSPKISPDATRVAFLVHRGDLEKNCYRTCLWLVNLNADLNSNDAAPVQLTFAGREGLFCWSNTGREIYFMRDHKAAGANTGDDEKVKQELYCLDLRGGEARLVAKLPRGVVNMWDLGNGEMLLLTSDPRDDRSKNDREDCLVFEQIPFCSNGRGFTAQGRLRLSLLRISDLNSDLNQVNQVRDLESRDAQDKRELADLVDLTPETMNVISAKVVPAAGENENVRVLVVGQDYTDVMPATSGVWEIALDLNNINNNARLTQVLPQGTYRWSCAVPFGDDNNKILATGTDMKRYGINENRKFFTINFKSGTGDLKCLTPDLDTALSNSTVTDCRMGCDHAVVFKVDNASDTGSESRAWFITTEGYRAKLCTLDANGVVRSVVGGDGEPGKIQIRSVDDFDVKNGRAVIVALAGLGLPELYLAEPESAKINLRQLTQFNAKYFENLDLSVPEHVRIENGTPEGIDGWYMRPVGFEVGKKYPVILNIHGGPKGAFGDLFHHEMQCWAAKGFCVLFCNPRGSDGRGNAFADIRGHYGYEDYQDLMTFVDWAVHTLPFVDSNRIGVTGGSYGGFMTNWIIGHTDRFRAAVTQRSISNWVSMVGMSDIGYFFAPDQQGGDLGENIDALWEHSPLKYIGQARTPTLIIHSEQDYRCELGQGMQIFTALKRNGVDCKMIMFYGENHELSRSGRPRPRLARLREITNWMLEKL